MLQAVGERTGLLDMVVPDRDLMSVKLPEQGSVLSVSK
jgi:hypothetical protein